MSFHRWCLLVAALVYFTAAWFGVGYHAEDEFQHVILFAEHLRGHVDETALPLDYQAHWRSMLQPLLCAGVFEVCEAIGITDPFQLTLVLRLITATCALWIANGFIRSVLPSLKDGNRTAFIALQCFLWFLPVLQIRFSGEAWSGLFFLGGLGRLIADRRSRLAGACFGLSVLFRPATALLVMGAVLWWIVLGSPELRRITVLIGSAVLVLLLGGVLDSVIYGHPVSTLWSYGLAAITGEEADRFSQLPLYQYVLFALKYATLPIGALIIVAFALLLWLKPRHVLVWIIVPFVLVHSILPVKEVRFLFPLAPLMPWLLVATWEALQDRWPQLMARDLWMRLLFPFAVVNLISLFVAVLTPASNGRIVLAQAIRDRYGDQPVHIDQLGDWRQWIPTFFLAPKSRERLANKIVVDPKVNGPIHLIIAKESLELDRIDNLERMARALPTWSDRLLGWYHLEDAHDPLVLYRVTTETTGH